MTFIDQSTSNFLQYSYLLFIVVLEYFHMIPNVNHSVLATSLSYPIASLAFTDSNREGSCHKKYSNRNRKKGNGGMLDGGPTSLNDGFFI